jgi:hypothetical protein
MGCHIARAAVVPVVTAEAVVVEEPCHACRMDPATYGAFSCCMFEESDEGPGCAYCGHDRMYHRAPDHEACPVAEIV